MPFPPPGDLLDPGIELASLVSPAFQADHIKSVNIMAVLATISSSNPRVRDGWIASLIQLT